MISTPWLSQRISVRQQRTNKKQRNRNISKDRGYYIYRRYLKDEWTASAQHVPSHIYHSHSHGQSPNSQQSPHPDTAAARYRLAERPQRHAAARDVDNLVSARRAVNYQRREAD